MNRLSGHLQLIMDAAAILGPMRPLTEPVEVDLDEWRWLFEGRGDDG